MGRSPCLALYLAASELALPVARRILRRRLQAGKEDPERLGERLGIPGVPRPEGPLVWFHAASVGEALSLLDLIKKLLDARPALHILVTTGTRTSATLLAQRIPPRAVHQFVPLDAARAVRGFLAHWKPDVAIWTESELWPALLHHTHRTGCPMLLINARMSANSARRLGWVRGFAASLLNRFTRIMAQDEISADRLYRLGADPARIEVTGSLKDSATALPYDEEKLKDMSKRLAGRQVWLAASTHPGEEAMVARAHRQARRTAHGLVLILVPRHPERGPELAATLRKQGWRVACRSAGERLARDTEILLADTLGEMGLWYRLSPISFVGGSLVDIGGHNPFEPALLGSAILHGPHVANFESAYARFADAKATVRVPDAEALGPSLIETLPADRTASLAAAAWRVSSEGTDVATNVCSAILDLLDARAA